MKDILKIAILMLLILAISLALVIALKAFGISEGWLTRYIPFAVMIIVTLVSAKKIDKIEFKDLGLGTIAGNIPMALILLCASGIPVLISLLFGNTIELMKPLEVSGLSYIPYYALVAFSEEFLYRGYIGKLLEKNRNIVRAAISALAFAAFHFISPEFNLVNFIMLFIFGVIFMYMYVFVKSLWPLILFHFGWDLLCDYFSVYQDVIACVISLLLILLTLMLISRIKSRKAGLSNAL